MINLKGMDRRIVNTISIRFQDVRNKTANVFLIQILWFILKKLLSQHRVAQERHLRKDIHPSNFNQRFDLF